MRFVERSLMEMAEPLPDSLFGRTKENKSQKNRQEKRGKEGGGV